MERLWLLKGAYEAPGWRPLEADSRANKVELLLFDRAEWALVNAAEPPTQYEGLVPKVPADGLYLDDQGRGFYLVGAKLVKGAAEVLATLGPQAQEMLRKIGDADTVLHRLGRVF